MVMCMMPSALVFASGNTYYVSPSGDDIAGDGSEGNPWATLYKAAQELQAGDTAIFADGTYEETEYTVFSNSGTDGAPITIKAENKHGAIISYAENLNREKLDITKSYITVQDFVITQEGSHETSKDILLNCGIGKGNEIEGCQIIGNKFYNVYEEGIKVKYVKNAVIKDNIVENSIREGMDIFGCIGAVISENKVINCGRVGYMLKGNSRNCLVYNNIVQNTITSCTHGYQIGGSSDGNSPYITADGVAQPEQIAADHHRADTAVLQQQRTGIEWIAHGPCAPTQIVTITGQFHAHGRCQVGSAESCAHDKRLLCLCQTGDLVPVFFDHAVVPFVAAVHIAGAEEIGFEAFLQRQLFHPADDRLQNGCADRRRGRANHRAVRKGNGSVAQHAAIVEHQIGGLEQAEVQAVSGGDGGGMLKAGKGNDESTALFRLKRQQHRHGIASGVGDGDQHVARLDGVALKQRRHPFLAALLERAACGADVEHQLFIQDRADTRHTAGAVENLQREQMAVAGAERIDHAAGLETSGDFPGGELHGVSLRFPGAGDQCAQIVKIRIDGVHG